MLIVNLVDIYRCFTSRFVRLLGRESTVSCGCKIELGWYWWSIIKATGQAFCYANKWIKKDLLKLILTTKKNNKNYHFKKKTIQYSTRPRTHEIEDYTITLTLCQILYIKVNFSKETMYWAYIVPKEITELKERLWFLTYFTFNAR